MVIVKDNVFVSFRCFPPVSTTFTQLSSGNEVMIYMTICLSRCSVPYKKKNHNRYVAIRSKKDTKKINDLSEYLYPFPYLTILLGEAKREWMNHVENCKDSPVNGCGEFFLEPQYEVDCVARVDCHVARKTSRFPEYCLYLFHHVCSGQKKHWWVGWFCMTVFIL